MQVIVKLTDPVNFQESFTTTFNYLKLPTARSCPGTASRKEPGTTSIRKWHRTSRCRSAIEATEYTQSRARLAASRGEQHADASVRDGDDTVGDRSSPVSTSVCPDRVDAGLGDAAGRDAAPFPGSVAARHQQSSGNEYLVTDYVKSVLEKEGIPVQILASDPSVPTWSPG
jgi:hypothetical protein